MKWERKPNIKTAVKRPILKLRLPNLVGAFYFTSRCIPPFKTYFNDVTHDTFHRFRPVKGFNVW